MGEQNACGNQEEEKRGMHRRSPSVLSHVSVVAHTCEYLRCLWYSLLILREVRCELVVCVCTHVLTRVRIHAGLILFRLPETLSRSFLPLLVFNVSAVRER